MSAQAGKSRQSIGWLAFPGPTGHEKRLKIAQQQRPDADYPDDSSRQGPDLHHDSAQPDAREQTTLCSFVVTP